jgi:hypothetical protein
MAQRSLEKWRWQSARAAIARDFGASSAKVESCSGQTGARTSACLNARLSTC